MNCILKQRVTRAVITTVSLLGTTLPAPHAAADAIAALEQGLRAYQAIEQHGGWPTVPDGPTLRPGARDDRTAALAERLAASGDLVAVDAQAGNGLYGPSLESAVRRFQARHGLEVDGLAGRRTLAALNVPVGERIRQIELNLERERSAPPLPPGLAVLVNVPEFRAEVLRDGALVWSTAVIVGETKTPTPLFDAQITEVVLNPSWAVPAKIAAEELLPDIRRDPGYLGRGGYLVYDATGNPVDPATVRWQYLSAASFPYRLVQRPGPANQLGAIKFVFPNPYSVFLHDTPNKTLFQQARRALSHGCIRMREPLILAEIVLAEQGWTRTSIEARRAAGTTTSITLESPVPIHIHYRTARADADGTLLFFEDIYDLDATGATGSATAIADSYCGPVPAAAG